MRSISRHLVQSLVIGSLLLYVVWAVGFFSYTWLAFIRQFDAALVGKATTLVEMTELDRDRDRRRDRVRIDFELEFEDLGLPEFQPGSDAMFYELWTPDGAAIARSPSLLDAELTPPERVTSEYAFYDLALPDGRMARAVAFRFQPRLDPDLVRRDFEPVPELHELVLILARPSETLAQTRALLLRGFLLFGFLLPLGTFWVVRRSVRRGLVPLNRMAGELETVDAGRLDTRFAADTVPEELRPVVSRVNDLLERLETAFGRERRLTADIAHELRTPIAELRLLAEMRGAAANGDGDLDDVLAIARQMEQRVETLLTLARCDANALPVRARRLDLAAAIRDEWDAHAATARDRGIRAELRLPDEALVMADPDLLAGVLANLMANAAGHAPRGGAIQCEVDSDQDSFIVRIANTDDQLVVADLDRLCEPFWQKNASRSDSAHAGLGLALAEAYARLLDLDLQLTLPRPGWFQVMFSVPAAETLLPAQVSA